MSQAEKGKLAQNVTAYDGDVFHKLIPTVELLIKAASALDSGLIFSVNDRPGFQTRRGILIVIVLMVGIG
jgi:hypothetical protein